MSSISSSCLFPLGLKQTSFKASSRVICRKYNPVPSDTYLWRRFRAHQKETNCSMNNSKLQFELAYADHNTVTTSTIYRNTSTLK